MVEVVKGKQNAESAQHKFEACQSPADRHEGWRYFFEKTSLAPGTDPAHANRFRQAELEKREAKIADDPDTPIRFSSNQQS